MAHELNLTLVRLNCYIRHPELGTISETDLGALAQAVRNLLPTNLPTDGAARKPVYLKMDRRMGNGFLEQREIKPAASNSD